MSLKDTLRNVVYQQEPKLKNPVAKPVPPTGTAEAAVASIASATAAPPRLSGGDYYYESQSVNGIFQSLTAKTDFDKTEPGQKLKGLLVPLMELDEATRFKAALAIAKSQDPQIVGKIRASFNSLMQTLDTEQAKFDANLQEARKSEIEDREKRITVMQLTLGELTDDLAKAKTKIESAVNDFKSAMIHRRQVLTELKAHYDALLGGQQ